MEPETYNWSQYVIPTMLAAKIGLLVYIAYSLRQARREAEFFGERLRSSAESILKVERELSLELRILSSNPERLKHFLENAGEYAIHLVKNRV